MLGMRFNDVLTLLVRRPCDLDDIVNAEDSTKPPIPNDTGCNYRRGVTAERLNVCVRQTPQDFFVPHPHSNRVKSVQERAEGSATDVTAWRNDRGELFYHDTSSHNNEYTVVPIGLYDPDERQPKPSTLVSRLKRAMVEFLWNMMEVANWRTRDLFIQFGSCQSSASRESCAMDTRGTISFEQWIDFFVRNGFVQGNEAISRQEWFTVFRSIRELLVDSSDSDGIDFGALRVTLLDPFHMVSSSLSCLTMYEFGRD